MPREINSAEELKILGSQLKGILSSADISLDSIPNFSSLSMNVDYSLVRNILIAVEDFASENGEIIRTGWGEFKQSQNVTLYVNVKNQVAYVIEKVHMEKENIWMATFYTFELDDKIVLDANVDMVFNKELFSQYSDDYMLAAAIVWSTDISESVRSVNADSEDDVDNYISKFYELI